MKQRAKSLRELRGACRGRKENNWIIFQGIQVSIFSVGYIVQGYTVKGKINI